LGGAMGMEYRGVGRWFWVVREVDSQRQDEECDQCTLSPRADKAKVRERPIFLPAAVRSAPIGPSPLSSNRATRRSEREGDDDLIHGLGARRGFMECTLSDQLRIGRPETNTRKRASATFAAVSALTNASDMGQG